METFKKGDYVLATKWLDGDPFDHWCVGFYDRYEYGNHHVIDGDGVSFRLNGFRRAELVSQEYGDFLVKNKDKISPQYVDNQIIGSLWDTEISVRAALQPRQGVDVEALKLDADPDKYGFGDWRERMGYNRAIDHLSANGYLTAPEEKK